MKKQSIQDDINTNLEDESTLKDSVNQDQCQEESQFQAEHAAEEQEAEVVSPEAVALRAEIEEHKQRVLRTQADFDNFRRRTVKEKEELGKYASAKLITELLPVLDNFERAMSTTSDNNAEIASYAKGVEMILRQFEGILHAEGLTAMETVGQPFNPEYHQAIMQVDSEDHEEGIVVEEIQKGYLLKDKVLRPAMVKVSS